MTSHFVAAPEAETATHYPEIAAICSALDTRFGRNGAIIESTLIMNYRRNRSWSEIVEACRKVTTMCISEKAGDEVASIICTIVGPDECW